MIKIGPAGSSGLGILKGLEHTRQLGLDATEVEFTYGVNMTNELAKQAGELAKKLKIDLSVHAPYYINLASEEKPKIHASITRILQSCERANHLGATHVVFHAAFYGKRTENEVKEMVKDAIIEISDKIKEKKWDVILAPETTGKKSQFSGLDELIDLQKELKRKNVAFCTDFSHLYARECGKIDYDEVFSKLKKSGLKHFHCHFSGIEFTAKGERNHIITTPAFFKPLAEALKKYKLDVTIINESPQPFEDAVMMKNMLK
ncbi:MAG: TIM barrel protein [Nanoarchaeota archaeon]|nr:TIM barrel protein [Nanoarchaeota archaeon]